MRSQSFIVMAMSSVVAGLATGAAAAAAAGAVDGARAAGAPVSAPAPGAVVGDGMPAPLTAQPGDAGRGRAIVASRTQGMCLLCHEGPRERFPEERTPGNIAGSLAGAGSRWTTAQLRLRVADARRLDAATPMPSFHRVDAAAEDSRRVAPAWRGKPLLTAQQVEDVVAFLETLR